MPYVTGEGMRRGASVADAERYRQAFERGRTFAELVEAAVANREMWQTMARRSFEVSEAAARLESLPGRWGLLALADD